jgi:serine phosphatase RsbU (regulator of sigma subunit)
LEKAVRIRGRQQVSLKTRGLSAFREVARSKRDLEDQLTVLRGDLDDLRRTMYEAVQVQRKLCGPRLLRRPPFEIAGEIFPVGHLSGDFICVFELDGNVVFAIGDIGGKGLSAGMWFTYVMGMVRLHVATLGSPAQALAAINRDLLQTGLEAPLTSLVLARVALSTGEITYCNAGHPPALLFGSHRPAENLQEGGPLLGALAGASFVDGHTTLRPGDTLLAYSDGIVECRNENGVEFGAEQLLAAAQGSHTSTASSVLFSALGTVEDYAGNRLREDDMALIVVRRADG